MAYSWKGGRRKRWGKVRRGAGGGRLSLSLELSLKLSRTIANDRTEDKRDDAMEAYLGLGAY